MSLSFPVYCTACLFFFIAVLHIISAPQLMLSLINILEANKSSSVFEYDTKNLAHLLLGSISSSLHTLSNSTRSHFQISLEMFIQIQVWPLAGLWVILLKDPSLPQPAVQKALEMVLSSQAVSLPCCIYHFLEPESSIGSCCYHYCASLEDWYALLTSLPSPSSTWHPKRQWTYAIRAKLLQLNAVQFVVS